MESQNPFKSWREAEGMSISEAAERAGVNHSTWFRWEDGSLAVGAKSVLSIEQRTNIPRHQIRPDLYPVEGQAA